MRAAVMVEGGRFEVRDVPDPEPTGNQVVLRVSYCGICGSDLHAVRAGNLAAGAILGHEISGVVEALGPKVRGLEVGDRVTTLSAVPCDSCDMCEAGLFRSCRKGWQVFGYTGLPGGYAEMLLTHASIVQKTPDHLGDLEAAWNEPSIVGLHAVRASRLRPGDTSVVIGAGPIGLLVLQSIKLANPGPVYVVEPSKGRSAMARQLGATEVLNPFADDIPAFLAANTPVGPDVVYECAGAKGTLQKAIEYVRPGGQVMVPGVNMEEDEVSPLTMVGKECEIVGSLGGGEQFATALEYLAAGRINVKPMITRVASLEDVDEIFQSLGLPGSDDVKVMVAPNGEGRD
jgi:(R,R)-butanediol dehydrogenase/meso-butanediol dehydrogenase/diacetyl reductase